MSIVVDALFGTEWADKRKWPFKQSCHLTSDIPGPEGEAELRAFARRVSLKPEWIQQPGTWGVHFDCTPGVRAKAVRFGAKQVTAVEMACIMRDKMRAMKTVTA